MHIKRAGRCQVYIMCDTLTLKHKKNNAKRKFKVVFKEKNIKDLLLVINMLLFDILLQFNAVLGHYYTGLHSQTNVIDECIIKALCVYLNEEESA